MRPAPVAPAVLAPPGLKAQGLALIEELRAIKGQMSHLVYRTGTIFLRLSSKEMLDALGQATFADLLVHHDLTAKPTAVKYMAVASSFSESEATALGVDKSYAIVRHAKVVKSETPPAMLWRSDVRIAGKALSEHTVMTLRDATVRFQTRLRERVEAEDDTALEANAAVRKLGSAIRRAGAPTATLKTVRKRGRFMVSVLLDADEAAELASRLRTT